MRFLCCGDAALVVELGDGIDRGVSERVLALDARLCETPPPGVIETVPTYRSLMIHFDPGRIAPQALGQAIERMAESARAAAPRTRRIWRVPVCYEGELAPDLEEVAERTGLGAAQAIELHHSVRYHVYMVGFVPGYPYMGDLPAPLRLPRRSHPRTRVPAGSVAIATSMTAIYALESPGGWHLIGNTPLRLFDPRGRPPALFAAGDGAEFVAVSAREHADIRARVEAGAYRPERIEETL